MGDQAVDCQGSLEGALSRRACLVGALALGACLVLGAAQPGFARQPEPALATSPATELFERRPYRISLHLAFDPAARIDERKRADLLREWQVLVRRFIGAPWVVSIADPSSPLGNIELDSLDPGDFASTASFDKVWVVRVTRAHSGSGLIFTGREYDTSTRQLGLLQLRLVPALADAPRALLRFARDLFNPTAEIRGQQGGRALLTVQGATIQPASPVGAVVTKGTVFQPLRLVSLKDGKVQVVKILYTYLQAESVEGSVARCAIISGLSDPLTKRVARPNSLVALGIKPGNNPLVLRFVNRSDQSPAAGYTLTVRQVPDGQPRELGTTDRAGRVVLRPGFAHGLVIVRLLAGNVEPLVELPIMPGDGSDKRPISIDPLQHTATLEAQLDALRDEVVDLVALRARLEARMKARLEGEDWSGLEEALKEFSRLSPREQFAQRLAQLKDNAAHRQAFLKTPVLTRTAQAQISELQAMIDRYMDDDAYKAYTEALDKGRSEIAQRAKAQAKKAAAQVAQVPPSQTTNEPSAQNAPPNPARGRTTTKPALRPPASDTPF